MQGKLLLPQVHPRRDLTGVNALRRWSLHYAHFADKDVRVQRG